MAGISNGIGVPGSLIAYLGLLNQTPPIPAFQFELWYSKWPRVKWFAQDVNVPGIQNKTQKIYYNGIETDVITNTEYKGYSVDMTILADEYGVHYNDWRNLVIHYGVGGYRGKPILNAIENADGVMQGTGYLIVKLINVPSFPAQHIWRLHNFKPTSVGDLQFGHAKKELVTFSVSGVFTHISFVQDPRDRVALDGSALV